MLVLRCVDTTALIFIQLCSVYCQYSRTPSCQPPNYDNSFAIGAVQELAQSSWDRSYQFLLTRRGRQFFVFGIATVITLPLLGT
jgi:hypothetical protein